MSAHGVLEAGLEVLTHEPRRACGRAMADRGGFEKNDLDASLRERERAGTAGETSTNDGDGGLGVTAERAERLASAS